MSNALYNERLNSTKIMEDNKSEDDLREADVPVGHKVITSEENDFSNQRQEEKGIEIKKEDDSAQQGESV